MSVSHSVFSWCVSHVSKFTWPCPKSTSPCWNPVTMRFWRLNSLRIFGERFDTIMETQSSNRHCYAMVESTKTLGKCSTGCELWTSHSSPDGRCYTYSGWHGEAIRDQESWHNAVATFARLLCVMCKVNWIHHPCRVFICFHMFSRLHCRWSMMILRLVRLANWNGCNLAI